MERVDEALPSIPRRPPVAQHAKERLRDVPTSDRRGASLADRLLVGAALLLVVSAAGLASGTRFELVFFGLFGLGLVLTLTARRMLAVDARARKASRGSED
jgi:hypothetical protein